MREECGYSRKVLVFEVAEAEGEVVVEVMRRGEYRG